MANEENLIPFEKGKSGNPNGRPKKLISHINEELKLQGYDPVKNANIKDAYLTLIQLPYDEIKSIANPKEKEDYPFLFKLVAKELIGKRGFEMLEKLLDRSLGKPTQKSDVTTKGKPLNVSILNIDPLSNEDDNGTS